MEQKGFFITGTDTCVGKTTIAAAIAWNMKRKGLDVGVMKPFATADKRYSLKYKSADAGILATVADVSDTYDNINPFFYTLPTAPYTASLVKRSARVDISRAISCYYKLASLHDRMIVEGIGGILVPLTRNKSLADFARAINLPVLVVARFQIGMINHILLTLSACVDYSLKVKGIILNDLTNWKGQVKKKVLIETIEKVSKVRVVATIPFMENDTPKKVAEALETSRSLSTKKSLFHY